MESRTVARIIVLAGGGPREWILGERLAIGRSVPDEPRAEGELALGEPSASRQHAEIRRIDIGRYEIRDLGSLNGTQVNGQRIAQPREIFHGDEICIGKARLRFDCPECLRDAPASPDPLQAPASPSAPEGAELAGRTHREPTEPAVALVATVRSFGGLIEKLPRLELDVFMEDWRSAAGDRFRAHGGGGGEVLEDGAGLASCWRVSGDPAACAERALATARELLECARVAEERFSERFERGFFEIGIGLHVRPPRSPRGSDPVQVALQLAALSKEKGCSICLSAAFADCVSWPSASSLSALGTVPLEGGDPVEALALVTWD